MSGSSSARGHRRLTLTVVGMGLVVAILALSAGRSASAKTDTSAPAFVGLRSAITCVPGPGGPGRTSSYRLSWDSADDDRTPAVRMVYDVYQATSPGAQQFSVPTYTTA